MFEQFFVLWAILFNVKVVRICYWFYMNKKNPVQGVLLFKITPLKDF